MAVQDIVRIHPYSWNIKTSTAGSLSTGSFALSADYLPQWHLEDARIVTSSSSDDDYIFTEISVKDRDQYTTSDYVYWLTYNTSTSVYNFNSLTQSGTVPYYYHFRPADMSSDSDECIVPDGEAVAYLAASKINALDPATKANSDKYLEEAMRRIENMYVSDLKFGINLKSSLDLIGVKNKDGYLFNSQKKS